MIASARRVMATFISSAIIAQYNNVQQKEGLIYEEN